MINNTINGVKGEKTILLYKLTEQFPFEVTLCSWDISGLGRPPWAILEALKLR